VKTVSRVKTVSLQGALEMLVSDRSDASLYLEVSEYSDISDGDVKALIKALCSEKARYTRQLWLEGYRNGNALLSIFAAFMGSAQVPCNFTLSLPDNAVDDTGVQAFSRAWLLASGATQLGFDLSH
jgi:hypothetical protein